jgi:nanoRNase/pAp phosphatase (c-di-AMP/oligoRNAs hydrolase)
MAFTSSIVSGKFKKVKNGSCCVNRSGRQHNDKHWKEKLMPTSGRERLKLFYTLFQARDHVLVVINADPDAIASAMAVRRLLWKKVASVTLASINVMERPDNIAMVRLLDARLVHIDTVDIRQYNRFVIVDSQPDHHERFSAFKADVIIDHHPGGKPPAAGYVDIRPEYGATASMMIEYLKAARIVPAMKLATALFLGIKVDTGDFERRVLMEDMRAFQYIYRHTNVYLARRIQQEEISRDFLKYFSRALDGHVIRQNRVVVHLDQVDSPDVCVILADFFMRVSAIRWSVVSGVYDGKLIVIFRNDGVSRNAGKTATRIFGSMGAAGGHKGLARAEIDMEIFSKTTGLRQWRDIQNWIAGQF